MTGSENKNIIDFDKAKKRQQSKKKKQKAKSLGGMIRDFQLKKGITLADVIRWAQFLIFLALASYVLRRCGLF